MYICYVAGGVVSVLKQHKRETLVLNASIDLLVFAVCFHYTSYLLNPPCHTREFMPKSIT